MQNDKNDNGSFKLKISEWRGYVARALEDIDKRTEQIDRRLVNIEKGMTHLRVKLVGIGATVSFLVTVVILLLKEAIIK